MTTRPPMTRRADARPDERRQRSRPRVRTLLLLVVLLPTSTMAALAVAAAQSARTTRDAAIEVGDDAERLLMVVGAQLAVADEHLVSLVGATAAQYGLDLDELSNLLEIDFVAELRRARAAVDDDPFLARLDPEGVGITPLRRELDEGAVPVDRVSRVFGDLTDVLDSTWQVRLDVVERRVTSSALPGSVQARVRETDEAFAALQGGTAQLTLLARSLIAEPTDDEIVALVEADHSYETAIDELQAHLGPEASAAWRAHRSDPSAQRFERLRQAVMEAVVAGTTAELRAEASTIGPALADGVPWARTLSATVRAAGDDLRTESRRQADAATSELEVKLIGSASLTALSLLGALVLARYVTRPMRRLESAAREIREGRFDLEPLAVAGPRELADTADAFNDMASTLSTVEDQAVALAEDPEANAPSAPLPGRIGRALDVALNRLRTSMHVAEERRRELEEAATHDGLTGLLNTAAALQMVERDLSLLARTGGREVALFIDLDELKSVNDSYGHATGDEAIRLVADALRGATRRSDIVARLGGDEFLVAGMVTTAAEVDPLAARVLAAVSAQPLTVPEGSIPLRCSIGIALSTQDDVSPDRLIGDADAAMYEAKRAGGNQVAWHPDSMPAAPSGER